jgi:hypothetical protein
VLPISAVPATLTSKPFCLFHFTNSLSFVRKTVSVLLPWISSMRGFAGAMAGSLYIEKLVIRDS